MSHQTSEVVHAAYRKGWADAVAQLRDPEEYHAFIADHPDRDILALLPSQRRAAALYLDATTPEKVPAIHR